MCGYCRNSRQDLAERLPIDTMDGVTIELSCEEGTWEILATGYCDGGYICGDKKVEVNYCPMCGRSLAGVS